MTTINSSFFEFIPVQMNVSTSIIRDALEPLELRNLVAKIVVLTIFPFLMIASFEALVINGAKILLNAVIVVVNGVHGYFFTNQSEMTDEEDQLELTEESKDLSSPALPTDSPVAPLDSPFVDPAKKVVMELPAQVDRLKVEDIVRKLAAGKFSAARHSLQLISYRKELEHVHPLQFLEAIFGNSSTVKKLMPAVMSNKGIIANSFLGGLVDSIQKKDHKAMLKSYIPSFAERVGTTTEKVNSFLVSTKNWQKLVEHPETWQELVEHLIKIHSTG